jgi:hypothetical protein
MRKGGIKTSELNHERPARHYTPGLRKALARPGCIPLVLPHMGVACDCNHSAEIERFNPAAQME